MGDSLAGLARAGGSAEAALAAFAERTGQRLQDLQTVRAEALAALQTAQQEALLALAEQELTLAQRLAERREAAAQGAEATRRQGLARHHAATLALEARFQGQLLGLESAIAQARLQNLQRFTQSVQALAAAQGRSLAQTAKALAVAEALISAFLAGNKALAAVPFPFNLAAAAAVTAQGLATVERIRQVNVAHGGLEQVPEDATFLLQRGERVLRADQNRDLTRFLSRADGGAAPGGGVVIDTLTIHVLENATSAEALLSMERADLQQVVVERLIPILDELARLGIRAYATEVEL